MLRTRLLPLLIAVLAGTLASPAVADSTPDEPFPFDPDAEIAVGTRDGLVTVRTVRFKVSETKLSATALVICDKGKDQKLDLQLTLLDVEGNRVAVLSGKGKVEEKEKNKVKLSRKLDPELLDRVESFQVALWTYPD